MLLVQGMEQVILVVVDKQARMKATVGLVGKLSRPLEAR